MSGLAERSAVLAANLLLAGALCPAWADGVYKSVDAEGNVVYSDRPITSTAQKTDVRVQAPNPAEVARLAKEQEILKAEELQRKRQQLADDKAKAQQDREKQVRCETARNRYYAMKDAGRIFRRDAEGNRMYYSDTEADAMREQARRAMAAACGT